ncbi:MAG: hypothetical protein ACLTGI_01515 [Hoylesella buccalis]
MVKTDDEVGLSIPLSFEVVGSDCEIEAYRGSGNWTDNALAPQLNAGERSLQYPLTWQRTVRDMRGCLHPYRTASSPTTEANDACTVRAHMDNEANTVR